MPENALFQGYFAEVRFETLEENQLSYVQNGYLAKFFDDLMNHIAREYAGKKMKQFLNLSSLSIVNLLL